MRPFTEDFREHIVAAYEAGGVSLAAVGRRFGISGKVVGKLVHQKRPWERWLPRCIGGAESQPFRQRKNSSCVSTWNNILMRPCWNGVKR